ncbi:hypothetical protein BJY01DRAFT_247864 [Aspergillus pseudoustus]|uniref:Zn(2)-C6 fungal-type domain-containing protein n=1 Tax=Aspergillus pseudoustus TaxID=1810923 RepID=A0ABR4JYA6_9EURO
MKESSETSSTSKRQLRKPKSNNGCRTCRLRRVKCDETPITCKRCIASGFKCDGYDTERLSYKRNPTKVTAPAEYYFRTLLPDKTTDERRSFNYFHSFTVPMMNGWFDHRVWNRLVLQMAQSEPAVCHAIVAVSALQEVSESCGLAILPEDISDRTHRFALYQYSRSLKYLTVRMGSNDPHVRNTVLVCCILFIVFELLRGNYDQAILHLQNGMHVLGAGKFDYHALYQAHPALERNVEDSLAAALVHLDLQSAHFGASNTHTQLDLALLEDRGGCWPKPVEFESLQDAWVMRDRIFLQFCMFSALCETLSEADITADFATLSTEQKKQQIQLLNFAHALDALEQTCIQRGAMSEKDRGSLELLRMHHMGVSVITDSCLIKSPKVIFRIYSERFDKVVDLAEQITARFLDRRRAAGPRLTLLMETGILGPMCLVIDKCQNVAIAQRALRVMESWPHREGLWDSTLASNVASGRIMNIQEDADTAI